MKRQKRFLQKIAKRKYIRVSVRSLCIWKGQILVQRPSDEPRSCYAFIGGAVKSGELMEEALRREYTEELGLTITHTKYLFVVENRFWVKKHIFHALEYYFQVKLNSYKIESLEPHLTHRWLPIERLKNYNVRPHVVKGVVVSGAWRTTKHLVVPFKR